MKTIKTSMMMVAMMVLVAMSGYSMNLTGTRSSPTVYDPNTGMWYSYVVDEGVSLKNAIRGKNARMQSLQWGGPDFIPVTGDFDNSGRDSYAAYYQPTGDWYVLSPDGEVLLWQENWGYSEAVPTKVQGDLDGDGLVDLVVTVITSNTVSTPGSSTMYIKYTSKEPIMQWSQSQIHYMWGNFGEAGKKTYATRVGQNITIPYESYSTNQEVVVTMAFDLFGSNFFIGDFQGKGSDSFVQWCEKGKNKYSWYIAHIPTNLTHSFTVWAQDADDDVINTETLKSAQRIEWGFEGAIPNVGDYNGDGFYDLAVIDPNTYIWYIAYNDQKGGFIFPEDFPQWGFQGVEVITK